jgi:glycosyltransferase involved in cell wall biosynthesis
MGKLFSVVVLVRNHRQHIRPCLETVRWADEVVVVNDGSKDGTLDIASSFRNVRIVHRRLNENWSAQLNFGIEQAAGEWVLQLDVDERVPGKLAAELQELVRRPDVNGIAFRILGNFLGNLMGHQPKSAYAVRMVRKPYGKFEDRRVHGRMQVHGRVIKARNMIVHVGPFPTAESFWLKNAFYAKLEARNNVECGERLVMPTFQSYLMQFLLKPFGVFLQKYLLQGLWRMGAVGLHYALMRAISYYMVYLATWERLRGMHDNIRDYCRAHQIPYLDED